MRWALEPSVSRSLFDPKAQVVCSNSGRGNNWQVHAVSRSEPLAALPTEAPHPLWPQGIRVQQPAEEERPRGAGGTGGQDEAGKADNRVATVRRDIFPQHVDLLKARLKESGGSAIGPRKPQWWSPQLISANQGNDEVRARLSPYLARDCCRCSPFSSLVS